MTADVLIPTVAGERFIGSTLSEMGADWRRRCTVVDNASSDGTVAAIEQRFPEVRLVRMPSNVGFGPAINAAARDTTGDALIVMNDDVACSPGCLERLLEPLSDQRVGAAAGVVVDAGTGRIDSAGVLCDPSLASHDLLNGSEVEALDRQAVKAPLGPSGGLAAYRRAAFEAVGGFDPGFFAYYEDVDLALRMRRAGWTVELARTARGRHLGSASTGWRSERKAALVGESRGRVLAKYGVLRRPRALPWLLLEALSVAVLCLEHRSLSPARARVRGFSRCDEREPFPPPRELSITSLRRAVGRRLTRRYAR